MASEPQGIQRHSPDKLLMGFSKTRVVWYFAIAIIIHIVATGATSVGYIRDRWIDPEGAALRKAAQLEAAKAETESRKPRPAEPRRPEPSRPEPKETKAPDDARKSTPVVKEITDLPKKGEIPKQPDDLGISIDETNK